MGYVLGFERKRRDRDRVRGGDGNLNLRRYPNAVPSMMDPCSRPKTAVRSLGATTSPTAVLRTNLEYGNN